MKNLPFILTFLVNVTFGQNSNDTIHVCPFELSAFNFELTNFNDITLIKIEISGTDTTSKEVIAQFKLNPIGQILAKKSFFGEESYTPDSFYEYYTYKYYPTIYSLSSWDNNKKKRDFQSFTLDKSGHQIKSKAYWYIDSKKSWWNYYFLENSYDNKGKKIKVVTKDHSMMPCLSIIELEYFDNGHIKNRTEHFKFSNRVDTVKSVKSYKDSKDSSYYQSPPEALERGHEIIYYNYDGTVSSKKYFFITKYSALKNDTMSYEDKYEYDDLKRVTKRSMISLDTNGQPTSELINLYIYNTRQIPNFTDIEDENGI